MTDTYDGDYMDEDLRDAPPTLTRIYQQGYADALQELLNMWKARDYRPVYTFQLMEILRQDAAEKGIHLEHES